MLRKLLNSLLIIACSANTQAAIGADSPTQLPAAMQRSLSAFGLDGSGLSIYVREVHQQQALLEFNADQPRNPGSTVKLLTTMAALERLTPAYQWSTEIHADGDIDSGILHGDLWLKGGGDPYLTIERVWLLVHRLRMTGLQTIRGDLYIDQSLFAPINEDPAAFDGQGLRAYNVVPAALVSNFNVSTFLFRPGSGNGEVDVQVVPELPGLVVNNRLRAVDRPCRGYNRGIAINLDHTGKVILEGKFPSRCKLYGMQRSVMPRDRYTADLFAKFWQESGGRWEGELRRGQREFTEPPMLSFDSVPLGDAIRSINKYSNNLMTRMLFLTLGLEEKGPPATAEKARSTLHDWLGRHGINTAGLHVDNGAGSSRNTRLTARQMAGILGRAWRSPYMAELVASMAITGQDGTFSRRLTDSPLQGRARLKSGRLDHVVAMAGFVQSADDTRYLVVSLHNAADVHRGSGHAVQESLLHWIHNLDFAGKQMAGVK